MNRDHEQTEAGTAGIRETKPTGLPESDAVRKDMSYSPASETETERKQEDPLPDTLDDDIDTSAVRAVPGTGGPDDTGDVEVDPADIHIPRQSGPH